MVGSSTIRVVSPTIRVGSPTTMVGSATIMVGSSTIPVRPPVIPTWSSTIRVIPHHPTATRVIWGLGMDITITGFRPSQGKNFPDHPPVFSREILPWYPRVNSDPPWSDLFRPEVAGMGTNTHTPVTPLQGNILRDHPPFFRWGTT